MGEFLLYPQAVLLLAPALLCIVWAVSRPTLDQVAPRARAVILAALILLPVAAIGVPYLPEFAPHLRLPWRAPIAWGIANFPAQTDWIEHSILTLIAAVLVLVPPCALALFLIRASLDARRLRAGLGGEPHRAGFVLVPGHSVACTIGLWRPAIFLSADIWEGGHGRPILAHEQAHVRGRHNLLMILAGASLTLWWWIPGTRRLLDDLRQALEESADASAVRRHDRIRVARAILDSAAADAPTPALAFRGAVNLEHRILALSRNPRPWRTRALLGTSALAALLWLVLL